MSKDDKPKVEVKPQLETGSDVIRERLRIWAHHGSLAALANDIGAPVNSLDAFIRAGGKLAPETLKALTAIILPHAIYDHSCDRLRPATKRASVPMGLAPAPYTARPENAYPPISKPQPGPPPLFDPATRKRTSKPARPGWAE